MLLLPAPHLSLPLFPQELFHLRSWEGTILSLKALTYFLLTECKKKEKKVLLFLFESLIHIRHYATFHTLPCLFLQQSSEESTIKVLL